MKRNPKRPKRLPSYEGEVVKARDIGTLGLLGHKERVGVKCKDCGKLRWLQLYQQSKAGYTGRCYLCNTTYQRSKRVLPYPNGQTIILDKKYCWACKQFLSLSNFSKHSQSPSGFASVCLDCQRKAEISRSPKRLWQRRWVVARLSAKHKSFEFTITPSDLQNRFEIQGGQCFYCECPLVIYALPKTNGNKGMNRDTLSIDRMDNEKGYTSSNIVLCCFQCNGLKSNRYTAEEMKVYIGPALKAVRIGRNGGRLVG